MKNIPPGGLGQGPSTQALYTLAPTSAESNQDELQQEGFYSPKGEALQAKSGAPFSQNGFEGASEVN